VSVVIWANHLMRSSIAAMQRVAGLIQRERSLVNAESIIAPLDEVFRLQDEAELCSAEALYLPAAESADAPDGDQGRDVARVPALVRAGTDGRAVPVA
jgi:phosphoenolpyruvate phosphomutase